MSNRLLCYLFQIRFVKGFSKTVLNVTFLFLGMANIHAQEAQDTFDYSNLKFTDVYSFYQAREINIIAAQNPDLYFEVYVWLNTPYRWGGRNKSGIDCSGFVAYVCNKIFHTTLAGSAGDIFNNCTEIQPTELEEGDLLFFNIGGKYLSHMGVYLQHDEFAHATVHGGVMVNSLKEGYYKRWFYKAARLND